MPGKRQYKIKCSLFYESVNRKWGSLLLLLYKYDLNEASIK